MVHGYDVGTLFWFEARDSIEAAIRREKQIKEWKREWKFNLIERTNPHWADLYPVLTPYSSSRRRPGPRVTVDTGLRRHDET